jgi:hypothetical protein
VRASSCAELAEAAALILALLIDPGLRDELDLQAGVQPVDEPPRDVPRAAYPPRWRLHAGPVVATGALPAVAGGFELGGARRAGPLQVGFGAVGFPASEREVSASKGGKFMLFAGRLQGCFSPFTGIDVLACMTAELGFLRAKGYGTAEDRARTVLWASLGPCVEAAVPLTATLSLRAAAELLLALQRPQFVLENVGPVYQPAPASGRVTLGVLLFFP